MLFRMGNIFSDSEFNHFMKIKVYLWMDTSVDKFAITDIRYDKLCKIEYE